MMNLKNISCKNIVVILNIYIRVALCVFLKILHGLQKLFIIFILHARKLITYLSYNSTVLIKYNFIHFASQVLFSKIL